MHRRTDETEELSQQVYELVKQRQRHNDWQIGGATTPDDLAARVGQTITAPGLGGPEALRRWIEELAPATVAVDHKRYFAFIPQAPTTASELFDLLVSVSGIYGGSWLEAGGAVYAENQALRWLADLAGFPAEAGGTFVSGGTIGNLSALHTARQTALTKRTGVRPPRWQIAASVEAHSSIALAARVLDIEVIDIPVDENHKLTGGNLGATLDQHEHGGLFAVVASAGATNLGIVDDLAGVATVCRERGLWLHVDGAYGLAAIASPARRAAFVGIEQADSFIVDPHKWLFAPYDSCALVYRDPSLARLAHSQSAAYLDTINERNEWNPADYAVQLSRRVRGLPFWFSLAVHGTDAYAEAIETTFAVTHEAADEMRRRPYLDLVMDPELTVLVFRRHGWKTDDYDNWSRRLLADGTSFVVSTRFNGEPAGRIVIVNPRTTIDDIKLVLDAMA
jgi:glutamate/tyrosine decarboxylase-like PLP-dependent enzyme